MLKQEVEANMHTDRLGRVSECVSSICSHVEVAEPRDATRLIWQAFQNVTQTQTKTKMAALKVAKKVARGSQDGCACMLSY